MMKLLEMIENKVNKEKDNGLVPNLEITEAVIK